MRSPSIAIKLQSVLSQLFFSLLLVLLSAQDNSHDSSYYNQQTYKIESMRHDWLLQLFSWRLQLPPIILVTINLMSKRKQVLINMSNLSSAEKQSCVKLLSDKNVKFDRESDGEYKATIVVRDQNIPTLTVTPPKADHVSGKKPLSDIANMTSYPRLLSLCKYVEVYVFPKKLSQKGLIEQTEILLDQYFKTYNFEELIQSDRSLEEKESFPEFVYHQLISKEKQPSKQQHLLASLVESVNFHSMKIPGIKVFGQFLSEGYRLQELIFLYFLRKMIEDIKGIKIVEKGRLKTDINTLYVEEDKVSLILDSFCHNSKQRQGEFNQIKQSMNYDSRLKKNTIQAYDLIQLLLYSFRNNHGYSEIEQVSVEPPQEQVSDKYNTKDLHELLEGAEEDEVSFIQSNKGELEASRFTPQQNIIFLACLEALKDICNKVRSPIQFYDKFSPLVSHLLKYVFDGNKMAWFQTIHLEPTSGRLQYIESLQKQYQQMKRNAETSLLFINRFVKRVLQAPGFSEAYIKHLVF